jgi:hypothetical protein
MLRSIAARASTDASTDLGRCDASRSMRAMPWPSHPSRRTHARSTLWKHLRMRAPQDEDGGARGSSQNRFRSFRSHDVKQPISFPRRIFAPGVCNFASLTPNEGVGGAPRNVRVLGGTPVGRIMTRDARLSALHRGGFGPRGRASVSLGARCPTTAGSCLRIRAASSSQPGRSAWRAGSRASRGERLRAAAAGRHASLRIQDRL